MKNTFFALLCSFVLLFSAQTAYAQSEDYSPSTIKLHSDEVYEGDYFAAGDIVEILGTVNGDVYAAGGQVIVDGTVNGDLLVAGGTVVISGTITQDVRAAGGTINISGNIQRNVTVVGGDVMVNKSAQLGGSLVGGAGNILIAAPVLGNIKTAAGNLTISSQVNGKVEAGVEKLRLTSEANVNDVTYWSQDDASIDETATIAGIITKKVGIENHQRANDVNRAFDFGYYVFWILANLAFGLLAVYLFPKQLLSVASTLEKSPWKSLFVGLATLILMPITAIFIMITVIGLPVGMVTLVLYFLTLYIAKYVSMISAGNWILHKTGRKSVSVQWALVAGLALFAILKLSPITNILGSLTFMLFGLGALTLSIKENWQRKPK